MGYFLLNDEGIRVSNINNFSLETPKDQEWIHHEDFERQLFDPRADKIFPEVKRITHGPGYYWFSYYDKFQTDPTDRFVLSMRSEFEHRSPTENDEIEIGMIDLEENCRWIPLGISRAWCWQQGCMLQWRPGSDSQVMWNDRIKDRWVCHILDVNTRKDDIIEHPFYHVSTDGRTAVVTDFARIQAMRPGYGYPGTPDPFADQRSPDKGGAYRINLGTGLRELIVPYSEIAAIDYEDKHKDDDKHYFNSLQISPDGQRFIFLNRWRSLTHRFDGFRTRMFTANLDGGEIRLVTDRPYVSHFTWRDSKHIAMWREDGYKLFTDDGSGNESVILQATNGHLSFLPNPEWMVADTYGDTNHNQNLYLYHIPTNRVIPQGRFYSGPEYFGEYRCDLHPRLTRGGRQLIIDSVHKAGRQMYMLDIVQ